MVMKEEARAAVETENRIKPSKVNDARWEDEFCQINGRLGRRHEVRTLISNAVAIFARHSAKCPHRAENNE
jgi:hypothetical protein